ncbi:MAG: bifunctional folylpolyglutamate synthase/dihydrofolate synthase [Gaiellaceae bacterium]
MDAERWIETLSPWPEEFGLERMRALLADLGDPQLRYPALHVVGTNGKSTTTKRIEAILRAEGLHVGATVSPHVRGWAERISLDGAEADFEAAIARVRPAAERRSATQFETLIAAALAEFAEREVEVAAVEAGLGGRLDATNVLRTSAVVLTNVGLEHTQWLGSTREAIAREKLAVIRPGCAVLLAQREWEPLAAELGAGSVRVVAEDELAPAAAEAFLGRAPGTATPLVVLPGRLEWRGPRELRDGAHNADGIDWLRRHLPEGRYVVVCSILADKDVGSMLAGLASLGSVLVATSSSNGRALPADELARLARPHFPSVETVPDPLAAVRRGHELAARGERVLVTGSLYLLADLARKEEAGGR